MTAPVPRWVIVALAITFLVAFALGIAIEGGDWASSHPFSVNLFSSLAGFTASAVFASVVVNRLTRSRYWAAELDARTTTAMETEFLVRDLVSLFGESTASSGPMDVLQDVSKRVLQPDPGTRPVGVTPELFPEIEDLLTDLEDASIRFPFLSDPEVLYRANRLGRKGRRLRSVWHTWSQDSAIAVTPDLVDAAIEVAHAAIELRTWAQTAPDKKMRRAVIDQAFRSDLD